MRLELSLSLFIFTCSLLWNQLNQIPDRCLFTPTLGPWRASPTLRHCCHGNSCCSRLYLITSLWWFWLCDQLSYVFKWFDFKVKCDIIWCISLFSLSLPLRVLLLYSTWSSITSQPHTSTSPSTSTLALEDGRLRHTWWGRWEFVGKRICRVNWQGGNRKGFD